MKTRKGFRLALGFTLIEIMIAIFVLVIGMAGILALFPRGLRETKVAVEESNAALVAQSAYASLRFSVRQMGSDGILTFIHDGMPLDNKFDIGALAKQVESKKVAYALGIPAHNSGKTGFITIGMDENNDYAADPGLQFQDYCRIGTGKGGGGYNVDLTDPDDMERLQEYSFNIQLTRFPESATNPPGLFEVAIHVRRGSGEYGRLIRSFYSQIAIPTD